MTRFRFLGGRVGKVRDETSWTLWMNMSATQTVIVAFYSSTCESSSLMRPHYVDIAKSNPSIAFLEVDVDECQEIASFAGAASTPTFQVYRRSKKVDVLAGASRERLKAFVEKCSDSPKKI
jgi:thioredoxin 1